VVGFGPGAPIRDYQVEDGALVEREPLLAPGFDGGAVAIAPDGRVAFTTAAGYAWTAGTAARRVTQGRVVTYRLDAQTYRTRWGRVFVDACLPHGTSLEMRFVTTDTDDVLDPVPATPPDRGARRVPAPDATPPQVPAHLLEAAVRTGGAPHRPYRRPNGSEDPWPPPGGAGTLTTYELPVDAPPGRYLWIELTLRGTTQVSPTLGPLRIERPGHTLLNALPRSWSRREDDAAFLHRLLAPPEGLLHELDLRAADRAALVDPRSTPSEALDWLCSFAALAVDRRWPEDTRRTLLAEIYPLFRHRGTAECLLRLMHIYLGVRPALIETWRLRGLAGTVLGTRPTADPDEVIGGAASRSAALGRFAVSGRDAERRRNGPFATGYDATAHRFTVLVPGRLSTEQRAVLTDLLDAHRPAHTLWELCELGEGMRIGVLRLDLTAYVGPAPEPPTVVVGRTGLGVDTVLSTAAPGSRLDGAGRVGEVRVG
jgi:phage tail-like protein